MRVAIVSDTHVTPEAPELLDNVRALGDWVEIVSPDLIVHLGDVAADAVAEPRELDLAADLFGALGAPVLWLPGNHDIGDDFAGGGEPGLDLERLADFRRKLGPDRWSFRAPGWQVIGLNAQLFGAGNQAEREQAAWLEAELSRGGERLGVMLHKPLFRDGPADVERHPRYLPPEPRRALCAALERRDLRFVLSGHTHQLRRTRVSGVEHVWAPSAAFRIPDALQEAIGRKVVGVMILELTEDGCSFAFETPDGMVQHDLADHLHIYPDLARRMAGRDLGGA